MSLVASLIYQSVPTRLRQLLVKEVSLVKRGANQGARVLLHKSEDPMAKDTPLSRMMTGLRNAFTATVEKKNESGDEFDSEGDRIAAIHESLDNVEKALAEEVVPTPPKPLEKTAMKCDKCGTDVSKAKEDEPEKDVLKSLNPEQLAVIQKAQADVVKAQETAADALAQVEKLQAESEERDAIAKAKDLLGSLPGDHKAFAQVLKALTPEETTTLEAVLTASKALAAAGKPFEEIGKGGKAGENTPEAELKTHAAELRKQDPKLSEAASISKAAELHPELYARSVGR